MNGRPLCLYAHRAVALAFHGFPLFPNADAAHKDGNKKDNHYTNIYWATRWENMQDNIRHGVTNAGEMSPVAKITWKIAEEIRKRYASSNVTMEVLSQDYGVSNECIREVLQGDTWNDGFVKPQVLIRRGENHWKAKLTQKEVDTIRTEYFKHKITQRALAKQYGVKRITIWLLLHNQSWETAEYVPQTRGHGEMHMSAKLTEQQVRNIRESWEAGSVSQRALARQYGVDRNAIRLLLLRRTWKHVG